MKTRLRWLVVPAFALGLGACKKETPPATSETPAAQQPGVVEKAVDKVKDAVAEVIPSKPAVSAEERAAKLGFVKHLPKNVESIFTVYGAAKTADRAKALKLWKLVEDEMGGVAAVEGEEAPVEVAADAAVDAVADAVADTAAAPAQEAPVAEVPAPEAPAAQPEEPAVDPNAFGPKDLWGSEVTIALGDTSGEQLGNLLHLYRRFSYFQMRLLTKTLVAQAKNPDAETAGAEDYERIAAEVLNDPEGGVTTLEKLSFPPIYIACKTEASKREEAAQQIASGLSMIGSLGDMIEPVEVEKAGSKFAGYKIKGAKLAETMAGDRESMEKMIDAEKLDRLFAAVAKKDIVILSGTVGDYVVLFVGGSTDQFVLATDAKDSLASNDALGFADDYLSKDLLALAYGEKDSLKTLMDNASGLSDTAKGIRDGLAGEDGLGETREIESLLQIVVEREEALRKLSRVDDTGTIAFFEQGLRIESSGGIDQGALDWKSPSKLGHLGESSDVVLFANATMDAAYDKASTEFIESIFETAYAITRKVSEMPGDNADLAQFKEMTKLFDEKFRPDAISLWEAFSGDFADGLGRESALVVDLKGTVPTIPGLPQVVVDQGKFPRASIITPVVDRAKVASSWEKMNKSATSILAKVSEIAGSDFPMQKPMSSEKNGMTTWFFSMPFFNDDFLPSVTVGDKWFVASTSKSQALDLAAQAEKGAEGKKGLVLKANFVALQTYARDMQKMVDANAEAIFGENGAEYQENKEKISKTIDALDDFDALTVHSNRDGKVVRTSVHFKTR